MPDITGAGALASEHGADLRRAARRPSSKAVAAARLANTWVFANLSQRELRQVVKSSATRDVAAGEVLVAEGTSGREFFVLLGGSVKVSRNGRKVTVLGPGSSFGELALLDDGPRTATVTAETAATVLVLGRREFDRLLTGSSAFARKLLAALAHRLTEADTERVECS
ncbi:MAG TPA: cyclic nucleotide-binding domain-containing protein [Acidimicrobiia bacterium]|nr:cyclic nucleotide-binding domain-containing protein [Acidimicrobiia bacterium]